MAEIIWQYSPEWMKRMGVFGPPFVPAGDKLEAVNRLSALTSSGPQALGPGSKERKSVLINLATGLGLAVDTGLPKPELGHAIAAALNTTWTDECWSSGQTITLAGLNRLLSAAESRKGAPPPGPSSVEDEAQRILDALVDDMPSRWDGRECIQQMLDAEDSQWAQDEWKGFYLEFLAGRCTSLGGQRNALRYGRTTIDYKWVRAWDFKTHSDDEAVAWLNDVNAFNVCLEDQSGLGFVVASGRRETDPEFRQWQRDLRLQHGKARRPTRKSPTQQRRGTSAFTPTLLQAFYFTPDNVDAALNSGALRIKEQPPQTTSGRERNDKYSLHLEKARPFLVAEVSLGA